MADRNVDVAILGGGLAGLCLALQLRRELPDASVLVAEKRAGPAPEAAFKVGESTVDLSAWYFGEVLGLRDHIEADQLPKCGLRFFLPADGNRDISKRLEFGPRFWSPIPSYQLDRGRFENELAARVEAAGAERLGGTRVEEVDLSPDGHTVSLSRDGTTETVSARWVIDAAGRASLLKRKLGLDRDCPHKINSSWFRLGGGIDIEDFSDDEEWLGRMMERGMRRLSTNHLMGEGYWCWLIPLSSGAISVGIVADPRFHPFEEINTLEGALDWLSRYEPQVADAVRGREDDIQDFLKIEDFSLGCERVYSADRWALTGEAGTFADPLYSPGSDFIAMSNLLIGDLIARDLAGEEIGERLEGHNELYFRVFDAWISEYLDQYQLFGNPLVFALKHTYNATNAWSVLILFYERRIADVGQWPEMRETLYRLLDLMPEVEALFRTWHGFENDDYGSTDVFPFTLAPLLQMLGTLVESRDQSKPRMDDDALLQRVRDSLATLEGMAVVLFHRAGKANPAGAPDPERRVDPYKVGLPPERWEEAYADDGGLTLEEARARSEGLDGVFEMVAGTFTLPGA